MTRAWAELLRLPALFTVPGDALTGAAATGVRPNRRTLLAITSSLCLYEAGMALNDWADRTEDALERPHRPLPSGRIKPAAALTAAGALTVTGLALASRAGRPALAVAAPLAATVWAYDLALKHTPAGPAAMATARALDLLLGAAATTGRIRPAIPSATALGTHTFAVTAVSRHETRGGTPLPALAALTTTAALMWHVGRGRRGESGTVGGGGANAWDALGVRDTPGVREVRLRVPVTPGAGEALRARDALGAGTPSAPMKVGVPVKPCGTIKRSAAVTPCASASPLSMAPPPPAPSSMPY